jgi:serine/threonine protein kinase
MLQQTELAQTDSSFFIPQNVISELASMDSKQIINYDQSEARKEGSTESMMSTGPNSPAKPLMTICAGRIGLFERIGQGAYGEVFAGEEFGKGKVAIKRVKSETGVWQGISQTTLREISLLKSITHKNVVRLREVVVERPDNPDQLQEKDSTPTMYLIFDMGKTDLQKEITYSNMKTGRGLDHKRIKSIMYQLLEGITFLHSNRVFHRDLKPSNILLGDDDRVLICDLGLSRTVHMPLRLYSQEILTLWYRAPELCVSNKAYSVGVDSWSIGCIFTELLTARPLFPATQQSELLTMIVKIIGNPYHPESKVSKQNLPFEPHLSPILKLMPKHFYPGHPAAPLNKLASYFPPEEQEEGFKLLQSLLDLNALSRITPIQALEHPYFRSLS